MEQKTIGSIWWGSLFVRKYKEKKTRKNPRLDQIRRLDVLDLKTQLKQI